MKEIENKKRKICPECGEEMMPLVYNPGEGFEAWYCTNAEHRDKNGYVDFCDKWGQIQIFESKNQTRCTSEKQAMQT